MDADRVVSTLQQLVKEKSSDVHLLAALSQRFHAHAEEFFPPQIEELLGAFASLGYADASLLRGAAGRMQDLASDASPRRVARLLRYGSALRLQPEVWLPQVLPTLRRQLPNMREGLPSLLACLHALRWRDSELNELLLTQGFIVSEDLGDQFLGRLLEAWSRFGDWDEEVQDRLEELAKQISANVGRADSTFGHDMRDGLNVLVGLLRLGAARGKDTTPSTAALELEEKLAVRLSSLSSKEAARTIAWLRRLALRSVPLWKAGADAVELALKEQAFVRDLLPDAVHALASVASPSDGEEVALLASMLVTPEVRAVSARFTAGQNLQVLHAASMLGLLDDKMVPVAPQAARLARQLSLPERRILRTVADSHGGSCKPLVSAADTLSLAPLPPLLDSGAADSAGKLVAVEVGAEALLMPRSSNDGGGQKPRSGIRFLGFGDTLAGAAVVQKGGLPLSPSCQLTLNAFRKHGWTVDLRV
eukprot:TRINITY_DN14382_c0_g2_i1.p1 TRINITY_DN14382_c0_g2~~TRINITY_DN14382_c0_g2_i1.p1  ORF type:complete len:543 (+),score=110.19 TRINITY_DN14382_c0_g2_i1:201-1631(+)